MSHLSWQHGIKKFVVDDSVSRRQRNELSVKLIIEPRQQYKILAMMWLPNGVLGMASLCLWYGWMSPMSVLVSYLLSMGIASFVVLFVTKSMLESLFRIRRYFLKVALQQKMPSFPLFVGNDPSSRSLSRVINLALNELNDSQKPKSVKEEIDKAA